MKKRKPEPYGKFNVKKGDLVQVISGKELGKRGKVLKVIPEKNQIVVEKVNFIYKAQRASQRQQKGGILELEGPINVSNVMMICSSCGKPVRVGKTRLEDGKRVRKCNKCEEIIDKT
ncbi:MAG: 50S ribosomal protein L24 [Candidatus Schekmanbacteria bacterium RBG_13_48_7]|uniref:Large ribosomal subunit protein uL24 n=1 Tax=Candidatus Schekmanbacteria bacterium RBG_13_48_7 TaxID=1817878 RepID=A0A1F7S1Q6_9BACT|nr:ribosomal protein L24 [uncultured bacterium]OGL47736.1 MAG: 50S ribosomal protein L24 [Candidatus Schekmanbacteria bacterium RBG_13_48_7]